MINKATYRRDPVFVHEPGPITGTPDDGSVEGSDDGSMGSTIVLCLLGSDEESLGSVTSRPVRWERCDREETRTPGGTVGAYAWKHSGLEGSWGNLENLSDKIRLEEIWISLREIEAGMDSRLKARVGRDLGTCSAGLGRSQNYETEQDSPVWFDHDSRRRSCRRVARHDAGLCERSRVSVGSHPGRS